MILATNIDDMNPEIYSYLIDKLLDAGALDVYLTNIMMKKNRPAVKLSVLCSGRTQKKLSEIIFRETTTLGIRKRYVDREVLERKHLDFTSSLGQVTLKAGIFAGEIIKLAPEYEECREIASRESLPLQEVYRRILQEAEELKID